PGGLREDFRKVKEGLEVARLRGGLNPVTIVAMTGLVLVVVIPFVFIVAQAIFPHLGRGSLAAPFSAMVGALSDPRLIGMTMNTLLLGALVVGLSALIAVPL